MANVIIQGLIRAIVPGKTKAEKPMHTISVEQTKDDGSPTFVTVVSYDGIEGVEQNKTLSLLCFDTVDTWKDKRTEEPRARVKYIFKSVLGRK